MRILLVEDDPKMASLLRKGLEEERHAVAVAATGPEGLDLSRSYSFDVIILDVMLPGLNGFEVARRLRQANTAVRRSSCSPHATRWATSSRDWTSGPMTT